MTTRASAAVDTALPSNRRSLLSGAALASLVAATAVVPAIAREQPGPIEIAYGVWLKAARAADVACEATWKVEELYEAPERPRFLHFISEGVSDTVITHVDEQGRRKGISYIRLDDANVEYLKWMIATPFDPSKSDPMNVKWDRRTHARAVDHAKDTLATIKAHRAECKRRADVCGLTAALDHERPLMDACRAARDAVFAMTPTTFREAAFQAAILREDWDEMATCRLNQALVELAGIPSYHKAV